MYILSKRIGLWSSMAMLFTFVIWIGCFIRIAATSTLFIWNDFGSYLDYYKSNNQFFHDLAKAAMLLFGPAYVIVLNSLHEIASGNRKSISRLGLLFGLVFAALSCVHYFVQLSSVRLAIDHGIKTGMENLVQANPLSAMTSIDMLGWTLFLGLSSLFMYTALRGLQKWISTGLLFNGMFCLLAMVGYLFQIDILTFTCINLGVGGAMLMVSIASIHFFLKSTL